MRLIDADVLMDNISKKPSLNLFIHAKNIEAAIDETPIIDAEPVRHGQWIEDGPDWVCSYCGTEFKDDIEFIKLDYDYYMPHYCPHRGAKMDLEVQDEQNV